MNQEIKIESCPEGAANGKCKEACFYQEGKWGENVFPTLSIEHKEGNNFLITCDDFSE